MKFSPFFNSIACNLHRSVLILKDQRSCSYTSSSLMQSPLMRSFNTENGLLEITKHYQFTISFISFFKVDLLALMEPNAWKLRNLKNIF